jgi:hypothetical protein
MAKGPVGDEKPLDLALDTGTPVTIVSSKWARELGLTEERSIGRSRLVGPTGPHLGYRVIAERFRVMGRTLSNVELHCHDLEPQLKVRGVLGLDILRRGELRLNLPEGVVQFVWA